jgi:hypothetical protein
VDDQHVLAFVEAVDGANLDAIHVFAADAGFGNDIGHVSASSVPVAARLRPRTVGAIGLNRDLT